MAHRMIWGPGEWFSLASALVWAVSVLLFKKSGESVAPVALNVFKNALVLPLFALTYFAFHGLTAPTLPAGAAALALLSGALGIGLGDSLYFRALNAIGASRMGVAQMLYSPSVILLSALLLGERLSAHQIGGVALVLIGIALVNVAPQLQALDRQRIRAGLAYAGASMFAMALGVVLAKPLLERYDFLTLVVLRIAAGLLGLLIYVAARREAAVLMSAFRRVRHWPAVIAGSIGGTYLSMMLWLAGYKYTSASIAAVLNEMASVFLIALAALLLREHLKPRQLGGAALALAGVLLVLWR